MRTPGRKLVHTRLSPSLKATLTQIAKVLGIPENSVMCLGIEAMRERTGIPRVEVVETKEPADTD